MHWPRVRGLAVKAGVWLSDGVQCRPVARESLYFISDITVRCGVLVRVSALKRSDVPKRRRGPDAPRPPYYLALTHGYLQGRRRSTWRLRIVPANYRLRYICQRGPSVSTFWCAARPIYHHAWKLVRLLAAAANTDWEYCACCELQLKFETIK